MAVWGVLPVAGGAAGLLLSGPVVTWTAWRWVFVAPVVVALAAIALAPRLLPSGAPSRRHRVDLRGGVLATAGMPLAEATAEGYGFALGVAAGVYLVLAAVTLAVVRPHPEPERWDR